MNSNIVTLFVDIVYISHMVHGTAQTPCCTHRQIGIVSIYFHIQCYRRIGNLDADCPQSDDSQFFSHNLTARKALLLLLRCLCYIRVAAECLYPFDAPYHIPGSQQHAGNYQLLHTVSIRTGSIEHHDPLLRAFVQWNVIDACTGPGHRQKPFRQLHVMHRGRTHERRAGFVYVFCFLIAFF